VTVKVKSGGEYEDESESIWDRYELPKVYPKCSRRGAVVGFGADHGWNQQLAAFTSA
jgi:hypothetical protein